jgi:hypothetical protein
MWRFEFKGPFLYENDGKRKFLKKTKRVSRNWLQKKCFQPMPPSKIERGERKHLRGERRRGLTKRKREGQP